MSEKHGELLELLGEDFYVPGLEHYYNRFLSSRPTSIREGAWIEDGGVWETVYAPAEWYHGKGFVSTAVMNVILTVGGQRSVALRQENGINSYMRFPRDRAEDLWWYVDLMMYLDRTTYDLYPDIVKGRFRALAFKFDEWGYDFRRLNPMWNDVFPR